MPVRRRRAADPLDALERHIAADKVDFVRFEQSDTHGIARSKTVPARHVRHFAQSGLNFWLGTLGVDAQFGVLTGTGYLEEVGYADARIRPALGTYHVLPWADRMARLLCEPYHLDGRPAMAAPRASRASSPAHLWHVRRRCRPSRTPSSRLLHAPTIVLAAGRVDG